MHRHLDYNICSVRKALRAEHSHIERVIYHMTDELFAEEHTVSDRLLLSLTELTNHGSLWGDFFPTWLTCTDGVRVTQTNLAASIHCIGSATECASQCVCICVCACVCVCD
jgi:hypothetical protein